jgi:hypothetical protein
VFAAAGLAEPKNPWVEQLFKTKFGHYSPMEEARLRAERQRAEQTKAALREKTMLQAKPRNESAARTDAWPEQMFKTKFGNYSPMVEARLRAGQANRSQQQRADSGTLFEKER